MVYRAWFWNSSFVFGFSCCQG